MSGAAGDRNGDAGRVTGTAAVGGGERHHVHAGRRWRVGEAAAAAGRDRLAGTAAVNAPLQTGNGVIRAGRGGISRERDGRAHGAAGEGRGERDRGRGRHGRHGDCDSVGRGFVPRAVGNRQRRLVFAGRGRREAEGIALGAGLRGERHPVLGDGPGIAQRARQAAGRRWRPT